MTIIIIAIAVIALAFILYMAIKKTGAQIEIIEMQESFGLVKDRMEKACHKLYSLDSALTALREYAEALDATLERTADNTHATSNDLTWTKERLNNLERLLQEYANDMKLIADEIEKFKQEFYRVKSSDIKLIDVEIRNIAEQLNTLQKSNEKFHAHVGRQLSKIDKNS